MNSNKKILQKLTVITTALGILMICNIFVSKQNIDYCYLGIITFFGIKLVFKK
ncbi:MAG: hypothetical protein PHU94_00550 [Bacilli bacterium]|nr:hypothetical protein [Bacilli bacterium]MDD4733266.1 hypothetical protein [Bacilli bacterium]